jgi:hypothetical protein
VTVGVRLLGTAQDGAVPLAPQGTGVSLVGPARVWPGVLGANLAAVRNVILSRRRRIPETFTNQSLPRAKTKLGPIIRLIRLSRLNCEVRLLLKGSRLRLYLPKWGARRDKFSLRCLRAAYVRPLHRVRRAFWAANRRRLNINTLRVRLRMTGPNFVFALGTVWLAKVSEILRLRLRMTGHTPNSRRLTIPATTGCCL